MSSPEPASYTVQCAEVDGFLLNVTHQHALIIRKSGLVLTLFHFIMTQSQLTTLHQAIKSTAFTAKKRKR